MVTFKLCYFYCSLAITSLTPVVFVLTIQYNTIQLIFHISLLPLAHKAQKCTYTPRQRGCIGIAEHCVPRTFSRSLCSSCLGQGSNPYSPNFRPNALTSRPSHHNRKLFGYCYIRVRLLERPEKGYSNIDYSNSLVIKL